MSLLPPSPHLNRPLLTGSFGMAAATHWVPAAVAQSVLERGGNAYDATVAAGFDFVPGSGALAAAVPGAVPAWLQILRGHGTWDIADVLEYVIHYAEAGQPLGPLASAPSSSGSLPCSTRRVSPQRP
jgi:gamma-glutamyltranspeptidase/glutathione hydrolase